VDETDALRFAGGYRRPGQDHLQGAALADETGQPLRPRIAGNEAEIDFGLTEACGVGGDAQRTRHRELASTAQRESVDRRDDRLAEVFDQIEDVLAPERVLAAPRRR